MLPHVMLLRHLLVVLCLPPGLASALDDTKLFQQRVLPME
ncbi:MAG: hypothetical protein ACI9NC_003851 [Verrucomicrobiales bacterium]|jgi:hypothetical protein